MSGRRSFHTADTDVFGNLLRVLRHGGAGVVPGQNVPVIHTVGGKDIGPILAHAHPMTVTSNGEGHRVPRKGDRKSGAAQAQEGSKYTALHLYTSHCQGGNGAV